MIPIFLWIFVLIAALAVLVKSSDMFTDAAEKVGIYFQLPSFIIGVTVLGIGTSLPELASGIAAVIEGTSEIVAGNVIGSNIANILLVLGAGGLFLGKMRTKSNIGRVEFPVLFAATILLTIFFLDARFVFFEAIILFSGYLLYTGYLVRNRKTLGHVTLHELHGKGNKKHPQFLWIQGGRLLFSGMLLYFGAVYTVEGITNIATITGVSSGAIAATLVALSTSLPELIVTITAGLKGKYDMAFGNVMGSNLFNIFGVMGITGMIGPIVASQKLLLFSLPVLIFSTSLMYYVFRNRKVTRLEGGVLLGLYVLFVWGSFAL